MSTRLSNLVSRVSVTFSAQFGALPSVIVQAPGRVNLIGEHTDYNNGFVLPCAIDYRTIIACRRRDDALVRVLALDANTAIDEFRLDQPIENNDKQPWANYVRGMIAEIRALGLEFGGMELAISGDVPQGAGLSSSASLEVAVGQAIKSLFKFDSLDATQIALAAQRSENQFVGCNCGIMDQLVSARASIAHALLIDCRTLETRDIALPPECAVLVVHSRVARGLVDSEYNTRRLQCEVAAQHFGVATLRDIHSIEELSGSDLDAITLRRARHVVSENARTLAAADALELGDVAHRGRLMAESHISMRDDFEISLLPIDQLVEILQSTIGKNGGARMTGGGFGGCVVAVLPRDMVAIAKSAIATRYRAPNGDAAIIYECVASAGASRVSTLSDWDLR
ncbi:MAG: galactokinase [Rhodocyclaceae bacterium]|nr:galactokinase [Rhodocyclaceae bacterium]